MNTTRIIVDGIPYKLIRVNEEIEVDDYCELCAIKKYCQKDGIEDGRLLCGMSLSFAVDSIFVIDDDIDKTIRDAMKEKI